MILKKNILTVQERNKFYIELIVSYVHPKIAIMHVRSHLIRPGKQILPKQNNPVAHHLNFTRLIHSLSDHSVGETVDNWTFPKHNFMRHTIVLGGSQFIRCIPLSKREAKVKTQAEFFDVFDKFT